ncbi:MAG: hypothetical protein CVV02_10475 [Firmicutes bacterium HGW-Firmicutes-7]|nr:MAG: hypothetical protein CVV02_10475 [Firmicutes bacterium HGW-Firmicutes-7]
MGDNKGKKINCDNSAQEGKVEDMLANTVDKNMLSDFINKNKAKIYEAARNDTKYNTEGKATISRNDEWFKEDEWDNLYKKGITEKK